MGGWVGGWVEWAGEWLGGFVGSETERTLKPGKFATLFVSAGSISFGPQCLRCCYMAVEVP